MMFLKKKESNVVVAVEAGTHKVVAAVAELTPDGTVVLLGVGEAKSNGIRKGEVIDFQLANRSICDALLDAEEKTSAEIHEVYLSLTGTHIAARKVLIRTIIDDEDNLIAEDHLSELETLAQNQAIPRDHAILLELLQHYYLDDGTVSDEPVGLNSKTLEASYLLVHGLHTRLETSVRCVVEQDIHVKGYALASYATAQAILNKEQKKQGAVILDIGAGTSDYLVYVDGAVVHTGVVGVGGDHLTQDLSIGLKLPYQRAEELKLSHGDLYLEGYPVNDQIILERDFNLDERTIYRESMTKIMYVRMRELFEIINTEFEEKELWPQITDNVYLTGGCSNLKGVQRLANEVFCVRTKTAQCMTFEGDQTYNQRPELSTVLGLLMYAQHLELNKHQMSNWETLRKSLGDALAAIKMF